MNTHTLHRMYSICICRYSTSLPRCSASSPGAPSTLSSRFSLTGFTTSRYWATQALTMYQYRFTNPNLIPPTTYLLQAHYRLSMLTHLHQLAAHNILNNHAQVRLLATTLLILLLIFLLLPILLLIPLLLFLLLLAQLHLTVESSALRLITGFGNSEIAPPKNQVSTP